MPIFSRYNVYNVHHLLINTEHKLRLRMMGMSSVLLVFFLENKVLDTEPARGISELSGRFFFVFFAY